jgi:hypothetical protein
LEILYGYYAAPFGMCFMAVAEKSICQLNFIVGNYHSGKGRKQTMIGGELSNGQQKHKAKRNSETFANQAEGTIFYEI